MFKMLEDLFVIRIMYDRKYNIANAKLKIKFTPLKITILW